MSTLLKPLPAPKQIRFVNNQGQPPSKRRRVNAACLTCRKRKTRCAGERPTCSTCASNGHECLGYTDFAEKKKEIVGAARTGSFEAGTRERGSATDAKSEVDDDDNDYDDGNDSAEPNNDRQGAAPSFISASDSNPMRDGGGDDEAVSDGGANYNQASPKRRRKSSGKSSRSDPSQRVEWESTVQQSSQSQQSQQTQAAHSQQRRDAQTHASSQRSQPNPRHRVPYFRYFGPTAIVPGYKQMVVDVSVRDRRRSRGSSFSTVSPSTTLTDGASSHRGQHGQNRQSRFDPVFESLEDLPVYDRNDTAPVHPVIINLLKTFFVHLGCNYPFLREDRVLKMVREKRVEAILVDAMCALAARFSDLPVFTNGVNTDSGGASNSNSAGQTTADGQMARSEYGHVFAQRAKAATVDTFPCPSVAAVQACLLMAYEGFGADQDSALWMYLGLAIRMAVDLGLQKKVGVTPQGEKDPWFMRTWNGKGGDNDDGEDSDNVEPTYNIDSGRKPAHNSSDAMHDGESVYASAELRAAEQERADTFWAVFFLDRVISSGTGRPVTFRDDDFELALPEPTLDPLTDWPAPFPILAQIIHLYGRVSDVLNNIHSANDLTHEKMQRLGHMENDLTQLYQRQDPRLNFNASNFQAYVRAGQGTTFILLHFWFHTLIIILHQPTLLAPFGGLQRTHQLLPNSHELSMSSAKTIADILAFAELIDPKSFIGNPFTSQPMYIAACAFLMESVANASQPASRGTTPPAADAQARGAGYSSGDTRTGISSKHSLLASNANQNYQRCYKSLQQLRLYWGGVRYILTALDQKSKGIWDCETFTTEELESTKHPVRRGSFSQMPRFDNPSSPNAPPIAWSLTGTSNSANPSLTLLFQSHTNAAGPGASSSKAQDTTPRPKENQKQRKQAIQQAQQSQQARQSSSQKRYHSPQLASAATPPGNMIYDPIRQSIPEAPPMYAPAYPQTNISALRYSTDQSAQQQTQQFQQQSSTHPVPPTFTDSQLAEQGHDRSTFKFDDLDSPSPGSGQNGPHGLYTAASNMVYSGQHQAQFQVPQQLQPGQQQFNHQQQQHGQDQHIHQQDFLHQASHQSQQPLPAPVQSYNTPSSHHSSGYEGAILQGTSPSNNGLAHFDQANASASGNSPRTTTALGPLDGSGMYQPDLSQGGLMGGGLYSYLEAGPITDIITFDSQEIDISSLTLPTELMPQWLEYLPSNVLNLFDDGTNRSSQ
ncbi:c6 zinc finger domain containing protein [Sporothrix brasiliensis 5110]|uniref:C6 zinc finger domain containing protein n=1 Tax=Sporothrix brasiliensis 5110 TaxID=1398154 RepID=A0A0C2J959_9PEZI|nr:c6 zinc finger domain containing protein [Sporothrix brasiliensis 5110]KIH93517.1 c6 zinc finger domain containing protein [Sporothrix brasiliensis 5110]